MTEFNSTPRPGTRAPGSEGGIVQDFSPCTRCEYDLRGLPVLGTCPECGANVAASLAGYLLRYTAPEYLRTVQSGFTLVTRGILLAGVATTATMAANFYFASPVLCGPGTWHRAEVSFLLIQMFSEFVLLSTLVLIFIGCFQATVPNPGETARETSVAARKLVRVTVALQILVQLATLVVTFLLLHGPASTHLTPWMFVAGAAGFLSAVAWAPQFYSFLWYVRELAYRIPDPRLAARADLYTWLLPVLTTVGVLFAGLGPLIALALYWHLLRRIRNHLRSIEATRQPASLPNDDHRSPLCSPSPSK